MRRTDLMTLLIAGVIFFTGCSAAVMKNDTDENIITGNNIEAPVFSSGLAHSKTPDDGKLYESDMPEKLRSVRIGYDKEGSFQKVDFEKVKMFSCTAGDAMCDATMVFNAKLNASKLTKDFNFIDYLVIPSSYENPGFTMPQSDFQAVEVKLTEVNDPSNFVVFQTVVRPDMNNVISGRAGAADQAVEGLIYPDYRFVADYGLQLSGSFVGAFTNNIVWSSGFAFDNEQNAAYAFPQASTNVGTLIRDLDDSGYMIPDKNEEIWTGFKSNELEVSLTLKGINPGATATIAILSYNGIVYNNEVIDDEEPVIEIENYPDGVVCETGKKFRIFKYSSLDNIDGYEIINDFKVYYNYGKPSEKEMIVTDNYFIPDKAGKYTIVATKIDSSGNKGSLETPVEVLNRVEPLKILLNGVIPDNCLVGESIELPTAEVFGGTSCKHYDVKVLKNNKIVNVADGELLVNEPGIYIIRYTAYDYLEVPELFDYCLRAEISDLPIVDFPVIPDIFVKGQVYKIPEFKAEDYSSLNGEMTDAPVTYKITAPGGEITENKTGIFKPEITGKYKITVRVGNIFNDKYIEQDYNAEVREGEEVLDYLKFEGVDVVELPGDDMAYRYKDKNSQVSFIKPLPVDKFNFNFKISNGIKNFNTLEILLTDSCNPDEKITLKITADEYTTAGIAELCGEKVILNTIFNENRPYAIFYNNGLLASTDGIIGRLAKYDNGKPFNGFSSDLVYFTCRLTGVKSDVDVIFNEICNHTNFMKDAVDNSSPVIVLKNSINANVGIGDKIIIPEAVGYDVFSGFCDVTFEMKRDDEVILKSSDGIREYIIPDFGKYEIIYHVTDLSGNQLEMSKNIVVANNSKPRINILEYFNKFVKKGESFVLPEAVAKDADGNLLQIYAYIESSTMGITDIKDFNNDRSCILNDKGTYIVHYVTYDKNFLYNSIKFEIEVR